MPRTLFEQTDFSAGELSPSLYGRTDIERYGKAVKSSINMHPRLQGSMRRRPGSKYRGAAISSANSGALIPFVVSRTSAFVIELGDQVAKVWNTNGTPTGITLTTPWRYYELAELDYAQGADTMFVFHPGYPPQRLRKVGSAWDLSPVPWTQIPTDEIGTALAANLTLSAATVGAPRTVSASAAVFMPGDVGRSIVAGAGYAIVTGYTDASNITIDIQTAFAGTSVASGTWTLRDSPYAFVVPTAMGPVGSTIKLLGVLPQTPSITLAARGSTPQVTASAALWSAGDVGKFIYADTGVGQITTFTSSTQVTITVDQVQTFPVLQYPSGGWGMAGNVWRALDVNCLVRINGGLVRITQVVSGAEARGVVVKALTSLAACPGGAWSLEQPAWDSTLGWPRTGTIHEQRLVCAGTNSYPQTIWGSRIGEYLDFTRGTNDDDGYSFTLATNEADPILYVRSARDLVVLSYGGERTLRGSLEKPITPTNVRSKDEGGNGALAVRPVKIGGEIVFVQRGGRKVVGLGYDRQADDYVAPDLTLLAEHVTANGIVGMCYQREPYRLLWARRADGTLLSCVYDKAQQVTGWTTHAMGGGAVEGACVVPNGAVDDVWLLVRRSINGATVRYLETLQPTWTATPPYVLKPSDYPPIAADVIWGYTVDCGLEFQDLISGMTSITLAHLVGQTVAIVADGAAQPAQVVANDGTVTLPRKAYRVLAGLPFASRMTLLTPQVQGAAGSALRAAEVSIRVRDTIAGRVYFGADGEANNLADRTFGLAVLDAPPAPFTGVRRTEGLGMERSVSEITIEQDQPLPMEVLSVAQLIEWER